jgi:predicted nuclease of predicted toxin-antitoxin system
VPLRFLIDENLTPALASGLEDAVHVNAVGLRGASDPEVLAYAVAEGRVVMTNNADDFRALMRALPGHPGLAVLLDAGGRARQIKLGAVLAAAIEAAGSAAGRVFEINRAGRVRDFALP